MATSRWKRDAAALTRRRWGLVLAVATAGVVLLVAAGPAAGAGGSAGSAASTARRATVLPPPTISSFTPTSGVPGTTVTINGSLLYPATVEFNGTAATITANTATQVKALVPTGATSGTIAITTPGGTATSSDFTVKTPAQPQITSFTPASGVPGATVTISGAALLGATRVAFNNTTAQITSNTNTAIKALVPAGASKGKVSVTTAGGTATSATNFTPKAPAQPTISSFTPTSGVPGATVTVKGTNLLGATRVAFNGANAEISSDTATQLKVLIPADATTGKIAVTTGGGTATSIGNFTAKAPAKPTITSFTPSSGVPGTTVTIKGTNLLGATRVAFNGTNAEISSDAATQLKALVPAGATTGKITLTTPGGTATSANEFTPTYQPAEAVLHVSGTLTQDTTWSPAKAATYVIDGTVTVPTGIQLTVSAGTVVKIRQSQMGVRLVGGLLTATGTAASPVVFTSYRDDSVGGDTNNDGPSTGQPGDYFLVARLEGAGARASLSRSTVRFGEGGIWTSSSLSDVAVSVSNSTVTSMLSEAIAVSSSSGGSVTVTDTAFSGGGTFSRPAVAVSSSSSAAPMTIDLRRNTFALTSRPAIYMSGTQDVSGIVFTGTDANTFTGSAQGNRVELGGQVPAGKSLQLSSANGATFEPRSIIVAGTLTLAAGTVMKIASSWLGISVRDGGLLTATGTAASPVVFTSYRDDSVGGDTNNDGPSTGQPGDYDIAVNLQTGTAAGLDGVRLRFASTAVYVADGAEATIHGAILDSTVGVSANTWVDATNVDWGDPSGPAPNGSGTLIQGDGVFFIPWVGYVAPSPPPDTEPTPPPQDTSCKKVLFIGVRGSGDSQDSLLGMGTKVKGVYDGLVADRGTSSDVRGIGLKYPALSTWFLVSPGIYLGSVWWGVYALEHTLRDETARCASAPEHQRIILAGFSQGALVIHLALGDLNGSPLISSTNLAAVVLVADPAKQGDSLEVRAGDASTYGADGIYTETGIPPNPHVPSNLVFRTITMCHTNDIVCAPGIGSWNHANYPDDEMRLLGSWANDFLN